MKEKYFGFFVAFKIQNRSYLGNKSKLLEFIEQTINEHCFDCKTFADVFGGTGAVADYFKNKYQVLVNDLLFSNYVIYDCFYGKEKVDLKKIESIVFHYNENIEKYISGEMKASNNYYLDNFKNTYLSNDNLKVVNFIRNDIAKKKEFHEINSRESNILITILLFAIDKVAKTTGHYDAFLKNDKNEYKKIKFEIPDIEDIKKEITIDRLNANDFVRKYFADIVYLDPPYNSRQYSDLYHFLENIAENKQPELFGKTKKFDRAKIKSDYCTAKAEDQFEDLIENIKAKYIILSFNNTESASGKTNVRISRDKIEEVLSKKGDLKIYEKDYNAYTTGKTKIKGLKELLFVCEVNK